MDWIKVKTNHVLYEYSDLKDSEFVAWIKIMALTAVLEHEPTREQMLQYVHYKTLDSFQHKLNKHSIDLQYILNKVSIDVQEVLNKKRYWRDKKKEYREVDKNVHMDIQETSNNRLEKIREDKIINNTPLPPKGDHGFDVFWYEYPKKIGKKAAVGAWRRAKDKPPLATILKAISNQKRSEQWLKDGGQYIPNPATWINQGRWDDESGRGTRISSAGSGISTTPPEWIPDTPISEEQRLANIARVKALTRGDG